jgi:hypothetical protein
MNDVEETGMDKFLNSDEYEDRHKLNPSVKDFSDF